MWRWWWWRENNSNMAVVVVKGKIAKASDVLVMVVVAGKQ